MNINPGDSAPAPREPDTPRQRSESGSIGRKHYTLDWTGLDTDAPSQQELAQYVKWMNTNLTMRNGQIIDITPQEKRYGEQYDQHGNLLTYGNPHRGRSKQGWYYQDQHSRTIWVDDHQITYG